MRYLLTYLVILGCVGPKFSVCDCLDCIWSVS